MYQRTDARAVLRPVLLADEAVVRVGLADQGADASFDGGVGLGHEGPVGLGLDDEIAPEVLERQRVGGIGAGQRERQPLVVARFGHDRILAPSGSYSGSRATSKPIHSPKTSTSPRVPIATVGGRYA